MIDADNILQTISLGMAAWTVKTLWTVTIMQAEQAQAIKTHHERIEKLEEKPACPHINRVS